VFQLKTCSIWRVDKFNILVFNNERTLFVLMGCNCSVALRFFSLGGEVFVCFSTVLNTGTSVVLIKLRLVAGPFFVEDSSRFFC